MKMERLRKWLRDIKALSDGAVGEYEDQDIEHTGACL